MTLDAQQIATPQAGAGEALTSQVSAAPTEQPAVDLSKIDLTQTPQGRALQSALDRQIAAERARAAQLEQQLAEAKAKLTAQEMEQIDALDPADAVNVLKRRLAAQQREQTQTAQAQQFVAQAVQIASSAGLDFNDQRLAAVKQAYPTPTAESVIAFSQVVAQLAREDAQKAVQAAEARALTAQQKATEQAKVAQVAQVAASGAAATSMAAGTAVPGEDRAQKVQAFRARLKGLAGKGSDTPAYTQFRRDLRASGLSWEEVT
jgi:hypothetical protein